MKARHFLLASLRGGTARTLLTANLAWLWRQEGLRVLLLESMPSQESELALHLGLAPGIEPHCYGDASLKLACMGAEADPEELRQLSSAFDRVLFDGICLDQARNLGWIDWADHILLVERGDICGQRRAKSAWSKLAERLVSRDRASVWFSPAAQALATPDLTSFGIPYFALAGQRLAEAAPPAGSDPLSPMVKALLSASLWLGQREAREAKASLSETKLQKQDLLQDLLAQVREDLPFSSQEAAAHLPGQFREAWAPRVRQAAALKLSKWTSQQLSSTMRQEILDEVGHWILGLGPLEGPLADDTVTEIMVNRRDQIFVEKEGRLTMTGLSFPTDQSLLTVIERVVAPLGRRVDESSPRVDARLPDGSRVNAIIPPLALKGPCLTIRKFSKNRITAQDLVRWGSLSSAASKVLQEAVERRQNIIVSGGTGSGKTTLLNALSSFIPENERIVTIEDSAELKLDQAHVVSLESRPRNLEGRGEVSIRDLVINSLRMRPDRIVVGECRSGEALDMLQAMNTGHDGSLTTVHANSPRDALSRLETLCLMSDVDLPLSALRRQICSAIQLIVQVARLKDGSRRVTAITEVVGLEGETPLTQDLFAFKQTGEKDGKIVGQLEPCGIPARFYREAQEAGYGVNFSVFQPSTLKL